MAERAGQVRALESARLDAAAQALWSKVMAGEERAQDTWLRNRSRYATLLGLDMRPEQHETGATYYVNTRLPPEVMEVPAEPEVPELEAGEAG